MVRVIHFTHYAVLIFVLTAWAWPWAWAQWLHLAFVPVMILHWKTNENRCVLSQLEEKFRDPSAPRVDVEESQFIRLVLKKTLGREPSKASLEKIIYGVVIAAWLLSILRLGLNSQSA